MKRYKELEKFLNMKIVELSEEVEMYCELNQRLHLSIEGEDKLDLLCEERANLREILSILNHCERMENENIN